MFPLVHGDLSERPPMELLKSCEDKRFTGTIEIDAPGLKGSVDMHAGQLENVEIKDVSGDPLEAFLALGQGRYTLRQKMLNFDGRLTGESILRGSLSEHAPADVLRFCEASGLSGLAKLTNGLRRVEVHCEAGMLKSILVDGNSDADLESVWGWKKGEFLIIARPTFEPPPRPDESGLHFLRVMEVALSQVLDGASRAVDQAEPDQRPIPLVTRKARRTPTGSETVQVYFLDDVVPAQPAPPQATSETRHASNDVTAELVSPLPVAVAAEDSEIADTYPALPGVLRGSGHGSVDIEPSRAEPERRAQPERSATPIWIWITLGAAIGGAVVAVLAVIMR